jgi:SAM-dependent methyltransferase
MRLCPRNCGIRGFPGIRSDPALKRARGTITARRMSRLTSYDQTIASYDDASAELIPRYDAFPGGAHLSAVQALFPEGGLALDVGAGSGRESRWLRGLGFEVVAVEPAAGLRDRAGNDADIRWVDDRLPALDRVHHLALSFDLIILDGVWQHVTPEDRPLAFRKLVTLLRACGVIAMTLRSGPAERPMHPTSIGEIDGLARDHGLEVLKVVPSNDLQGREGVTWTTMALRLP